MTRTNDPILAAAYIYGLIQGESIHGTFDGDIITGWAALHDYCDANEFIDLALTLESLDDFDLINRVTELVDEMLHANPIPAR